MKLKNIFVPFTCYFILAAFVGCISCGVLFHHGLQFQKSIYYSEKKPAAQTPSFVFEEDEGSDDSSDYDFLNYPAGADNTLCNYKQKYFYSDFCSEFHPHLKAKTPIIIHFRTLRL